MKLIEHVELSGIMKLKSGLHIGSATTRDIGKGEPLPVMKSPFTNLPYIPGSSLKGKMRCLLELTYNKISQTNGPCECGKCMICKLFGSGSSKTTFEPSRLIFRECALTEKYIELIEKIGLENKPGVSIDRKTGTARSGALFPMERIPEGSEFKFQISCRIFEGDNKDTIKDFLTLGLYLIEQDTLGGSGTRGSGHVEFNNIVFDGKVFPNNWREIIKEKKRTLKTD